MNLAGRNRHTDSAMLRIQTKTRPGASESVPLASTPFDAMAADYDASFTATRLGRWLRARVWEQLDACFDTPGRLLEIGCGTGEDTVHLAGAGHAVVATDASEPMLRIARQKAVRAGCLENVDFRCLPMEDLATLEAGSFDGAFSNFGAINCTASLDRFAQNVATLLKPGAPLVLVVMGRHVPWEWLWFLARLSPRRAFRRLAGNGALWRGLRIRYPSPREFEAVLAPYFESFGRRALGSVLPPSYASAWLERRPRLFGGFARLERRAQQWQSMAALADHYVLEARRSGANS